MAAPRWWPAAGQTGNSHSCGCSGTSSAGGRSTSIYWLPPRCLRICTLRYSRICRRRLAGAWLLAAWLGRNSTARLSPAGGGQLQFAQFAVAVVLGPQPAEYGAAGGAAQGLFGGPQQILAVLGVDQQNLPGIDTPRRQQGGVGYIRRGDKCLPAPLLAEPLHGGQEQAHGAQPAAVAQQLDGAVQWPAALLQLRVQGRIAGGQAPVQPWQSLLAEGHGGPENGAGDRARCRCG